VHDGTLSGLGLFARAHDEILNEEVVGSRAEVWIYEWLFRHESKC